MKLKAVRDDNVQLVTEILDSLNNLPEKDAAVAELAKILEEPHFKVSQTSLLHSHTLVSGFNGCEKTRDLSCEWSRLCSTHVGMDVSALYTNHCLIF